MPSLVTRRGETRWRASVMVNGTTRQKLFPNNSRASHRAAVLWEEQMKKELEETATVTASRTLLEWANEYLDFAQQRFSKKTYGEKRTTFGKFIKAMPKGVLLEDLTIPMIMKHLSKQARLRSGYSANKDRKNLGTGWNWGRKYMEGFPQGTNLFLTIDRFPEVRTPRYVPPEEDFWKAFEQTEGQDRIMLLAFLHLGARRGELFRLKWDDVCFHESKVRLWTKKRLGGHMECDWLPMTIELKAALLKWWEERPVQSEYVFNSLDPKPCTEKYYGKPFTIRCIFMKQTCKRAGVRPFGFHAIRHLTASILYRAGYPVSVIQAVLRHKSPNTTTRYLQTLGLEQTREALEEVMGNRGPGKVLELKKKAPGR